MCASDVCEDGVRGSEARRVKARGKEARRAEGRQDDVKDLFGLHPDSSLPMWVQLKSRIAHLITSGYYMPGDHLPTVRGLAAELEVHYNTVSKVYQSLEEDGYIESKPRQGAYVLDASARRETSDMLAAEIVSADYINRCLDLGMSLEDVDAEFRACVAKERWRVAKECGNVPANVIDFPG